MSNIQSQLRGTLTLVVILLLTVLSAGQTKSQRVKQTSVVERQSTRSTSGVQQERAVDPGDTANVQNTDTLLDGTAPNQSSRRLPPVPTPDPQDRNSNFLTVAQELDRLQDFFVGGNGLPLTFDSDGARRSGFSPQAIKLAEQMAAFTNDLMLIATGVSEKDYSSQVEKAQDKAQVVMQRATIAMERYSELNSFLSAASQRQAEEAATPNTSPSKSSQATALSLFETPATVCGSFLTPRPSRAAPWVQFSSPNPWNTLYQWGYHPTPDYVIWKVPAGGGWTRPQTYRPDLCKWNSFRDQALIVGNTTIREQKYTGWTPNGEPNPEVWNYSPWPYAAWPVYVFWWHQTH